MYFSVTSSALWAPKPASNPTLGSPGHGTHQAAETVMVQWFFIWCCCKVGRRAETTQFLIS